MEIRDRLILALALTLAMVVAVFVVARWVS